MTTADARLEDAIKRHDFNALEAIIESGYVDIDPSIWLDAIRYDPGNLIAFKRLLKAGANINTVGGKHNLNCLHDVVFWGNPDAVRHLVAAGANLEAHTSYDATPLQLAVGKPHVGIRSEQVAMALIEAGAVADNDTLCRAAGLGMSMIRFLLNRNVNVRELRGSKQTTPCHHVALWRKDAPEVLDMLVNVVGVDVNAMDDNGTTCVDTCAYMGSEKSMRWLLKAGATPGHATRTSPLHKACFTGNYDCIALLIAYGINVRLVDYEGRTALQTLLLDGMNQSSACCTDSLSVRLIIAMFALVGVDADKECAVAPPTADELASARRWLGDAQFDLIVSKRAFQVCLGLQPVWLPALVTCEILMASFGATAPWVQFHNWWNLATRVKHFKNKKVNQRTRSRRS